MDVFGRRGFVLFGLVVECVLSGVEGIAVRVDVEVDDKGSLCLHLNNKRGGKGGEIPKASL